MDSFDHYGTAQIMQKWTGGLDNLSAAIVASPARFGAGAMQVSNASFSNPASIYKVIDAQTDWYIGAAIYPGAAVAIPQFMYLRSGTTFQVGVAWDYTTGYLSITNGSTTLATGTHAVAPGQWTYIELGVHIHSSTGTATIHRNGVLECTATGVNTNPAGTGTADTIALGSHGTISGSNGIYADDLYACDGNGSVNNTFLGDVRVQALLPTSDGANHAWTPSAGSTHYSLVDEVPPDGDTSYVASSTVGQVDEYGMTAIAIASGTVFGVQTMLYARKDDAGTRTIAPVVREGGTDYVGATVALGTSYAYFSQLYEQDPATSAAWTIAGINGDQFGCKVIA